MLLMPVMCVAAADDHLVEVFADGKSQVLLYYRGVTHVYIPVVSHISVACKIAGPFSKSLHIPKAPPIQRQKCCKHVFNECFYC